MKYAFLFLMLMASPIYAQQAVTHAFDGTYEDATFAVESAILDRGLVIDLTSHIGDMLNRTGADVGSDRQIFVDAEMYLFCSAVLSREVMEADPMNIAHCPYGVFVADTGDGVVIGHRTYPDGAMQKVESLLDGIVQTALTE